ncbi:hypothetical protein A0H81_09240 [Grifola frondosa]|uniref:Uncharacterized protein n=1 Tax=Grifola frondosa TaxID=5627 RepID=A0A1C7M1L7_GRIFR|nr:hypothetical protein A0H81_09240 [Grifola frondosa]
MWGVIRSIPIAIWTPAPSDAHGRSAAPRRHRRSSEESLSKALRLDEFRRMVICIRFEFLPSFWRCFGGLELLHVRAERTAVLIWEARSNDGKRNRKLEDKREGSGDRNRRRDKGGRNLQR